MIYQKKKRLNTHFKPLSGGFYFDSLKPLFLFDLFLKARAETLKFVGILVETMSLHFIKSFRFLLIFSIIKIS